MKTILFGVPDFGTMCTGILVEHGIKIDYIVPPRKDHPAYQVMAGCADHFGIPRIEFVKSLKEDNFVHQIADIKPDLMIVASFKNLIPEIIYSQAKIAAINCHPSLLPQYRGANPYYYVIANGEKETGVTLHHLDPSFDTGNIIMQIRDKVHHLETLGTLFNRLNYKGSMMYVELFKKLKQGFNLPSIPQKIPQVPLQTASPNLDVLYIDWHEAAEIIERKVRAVNPYIFAKTMYKDRDLYIYAGTCHQINHTEEPGTVLSTHQGRLLIATGKGAYEIRCLRYDNMFFGDAQDFIWQTSLKTGGILGLYPV